MDNIPPQLKEEIIRSVRAGDLNPASINPSDRIIEPIAKMSIRSIIDYIREVRKAGKVQDVSGTGGLPSDLMVPGA